MRAKTLEAIQEQNCRSHCSFRLLHLLSPFLSTQAHSFQPRTNSSPSWPTSHLHFCGPNRSPMQQPIFLFFLFLFFSFLSFSFPHLPITSPFLLPCYQPPLQPPYLLQLAPSPITFPFLLPCKLPSPHLPITFPFFLSLFPA